MSTTQQRIFAPEKRHYSPSGGNASITENMPRGLAIVMCVFGILGFVLGFAGYTRAAIAEREARIIEDDMKYVRAWLSARGYEIPINHEEAEEPKP